MKDTFTKSKPGSLPVTLKSTPGNWAVVGGGQEALQHAQALLDSMPSFHLTLIVPEITAASRSLAQLHKHLNLVVQAPEAMELNGFKFVVIATGNSVIDEKLQSELAAKNILVSVPGAPEWSDFTVAGRKGNANTKTGMDSEQSWKRVTTLCIFAFIFMVVGHLIISNLTLPGVTEIYHGIRPYFDYQFLFFILAGFLAQMVDGVLSMGYGVTSATCLMSFGVNPVAMSAAIHTSEIFTTGISGYSHYKFGNVNKKLFSHLVIPGVLGAIGGALLLVFLGEQYGKWLMPIIAVYAGFLGVKILIKAYQAPGQSGKVKRIGWLAGVGGFLDSFGGGGWGPIVTSSLIAKGRSPKYTIGSVSLTEFFVTLASAFTFFLTVGVSHWNIVLGLLIGGGIAAPIAARIAGKLPRKTMMVAVGIMVLIWCVRMLIKSI